MAEHISLATGRTIMFNLQENMQTNAANCINNNYCQRIEMSEDEKQPNYYAKFCETVIDNLQGNSRLNQLTIDDLDKKINSNSLKIKRLKTSSKNRFRRKFGKIVKK